MTAIDLTEIDITFDPTYGLEILLFTSIVVFVIVLVGLIVLLYAPKLRQMAFHYRSMSSATNSSRGSRTSSTSDSDLESYYIPGQYADKLKFKKNRNPRLLVPEVHRNHREDQVVNSTYRDDVDTVSFNRYFPGLKELSRISALSPDDLMVKLQNDYETYSKMRRKIQARNAHKHALNSISKPYVPPNGWIRQNDNIQVESTKKLKSILKKSTSDSSTLNPSFNRPKSEHLSYVV